MVRWADIRFSHRFDDGPAPKRLSGIDQSVACWRDVARFLLAAAISALVLFGLISLIGNSAQTATVTSARYGGRWSLTRNHPGRSEAPRYHPGQCPAQRWWWKWGAPGSQRRAEWRVSASM